MFSQDICTCHKSRNSDALDGLTRAFWFFWSMNVHVHLIINAPLSLKKKNEQMHWLRRYTLARSSLSICFVEYWQKSARWTHDSSYNWEIQVSSEAAKSWGVQFSVSPPQCYPVSLFIVVWRPQLVQLNRLWGISSFLNSQMQAELTSLSGEAQASHLLSFPRCRIPPIGREHGAQTESERVPTVCSCGTLIRT